MVHGTKKGSHDVQGLQTQIFLATPPGPTKDHNNLPQDLSNQLTELKEKSELLSNNSQMLKEAAIHAKQSLAFNKTQNFQADMTPML